MALSREFANSMTSQSSTITLLEENPERFNITRGYSSSCFCYIKKKWLS